MKAVLSEVENNISSESSIVLRMQGISKSFSGVAVLKKVNIELHKGEVHALMGENGAGKSTFMKIMAGVHRPDKGTITYRNQLVSWHNPMEAREHGISVIHQELNLSPNLTIGENILMGTKFPKNKLGMVRWQEVHERAHILLQSIGSELDPRTYVSTLSVAQQQMVEIARALSVKAEVLVMDEPTASLTDREIDRLFIIINELKQQGVAIVYISHRMEEVFKISDRCTILRDGEWITSCPIAETNPEHLVKTMVGRELNDLFQKPPSHTSQIKDKVPVLEITGLSDHKIVKDISLHVHSGEIVGIAGLVGSGRTELVRAIFGLSQISKGEIRMNGQLAAISSPLDAMNFGIAHVPESRKEQGLFLDMSVKENILMAVMSQYQRAAILDWSQINEAAETYIRELGIKLASKEQRVGGLSGGNQQKVLLARWLSIQPKVLLLDEPTRGVDIGAKTEIHKMICKLAKNGLAVLMISSELPEVLAMSDRIIVMHEGRIRANLLREEATQEKIMYYATGEIK
ncbi:sugar ABC transporter ATP-binding protein [Paenibacillus frigoriresistens]|uniref:sugar ABC transporter ATP-binding protein n=1 Tax=Paenibacillus alginolyticus TaxID=59839 RepID=UPI001565AE49|nr:sugar ABC transporter ATP-binding protein [Paenibacillus frigoriresistens]NRF95101.1 sugar ABC transporter ATP-binding protein [Paenibacillus frigoriresistens]